MKSKKFSFYYLLFVFLITIFLIVMIYVLRGVGPASGNWFGPALIPIGIVFNPIYLAWSLFSILFWIIIHFINNPRIIKLLNWVLLLSPFLMLVVWQLLFIIKKALYL